MLAFASVASAELDTFSTGNGHEGAYTLPAGSTTLNYVAPLSAAAGAGASSVTIGTVRASGVVAAAAQFEAGRLVMIFQASGFPSASAPSGNQTDLNIASSQTGTWELARIAGGYTTGSALPLTAPLVNSFAASGAQVIAVPEFTTVTGTATNALSALPWDGASGGVTAFLATGAISLSGSIHADFAGFRGGALYNGVLSGCTQLDGSIGGGKGEGIVLGAFGIGFNSRGNRANGAGGGDCENAGGGGGGNGGTGGIGGMSYDGGGRDVGGFGGQKLIYSAFDHAAFGGGGGAGDANNNNAGPGGAGGGFVFMRGASLAGTGTIAARGADGGESLAVNASDGAGGGGAGGVVYARFTGAATCTQASVAGGSGGNEHSLGGVHGPGGGGAGGRMVLQAASGSCATDVSNGIAGVVFVGAGGNRGSGPAASSDPVSSGAAEPSAGGLTAPTASITAPASGGYINSTTPSITGTATAGATIRVTIDGAFAGSTIADVSGNWSYTTSPLSVASHTVTVTPVNTGLAGAATATRSFTIDTTAPVVTITVPDALASSGAAQSVIFTATDNIAVATRACKLDAAAYAPCTSPFNTGAMSAGVHTVYVQITDTAGNVTTESETITVDQTNPVVTVNAAPSPTTSAATSQNITFSATDANGVASYRCKLNAAAFAACNSPFATGTLAAGLNTITVEATDGAGNATTGTTTINVDASAPVVTVNAAPSPLTRFTTTQSIVFSATDASGISGYRCKLNAAAYASCTSPLATGTLAIGVNTISVEATDNTGNVATGTTVITVDQTLPVVTVNPAPSPLTNVTTSQNISFSAADANGVASYRCKLNAAAFTACTSPRATGTLAAGTNTITVEATDNAGNVATGTTVITVDQTVPVVTVNAAPSPLTNATASQNITFSATDAGGIAAYRCKLGAAAYTACSSPFATGTLAAGANTISVEATDNAGNIAVATTVITVDQTAPALTLSAAPSPMTNVTTSQNITFSATDANGVAAYRCQLNAGPFTICSSPFATGVLSVGANTITVEVTDNAGNVMLSTTPITVDQTVPVVTVGAAPSPLTKVTTSQNITFSATDSSGIASYRCKLNAAAFTACTSPRATGTLTVGTNTVTVEATDSAGNIATSTTTVVVDQTNPVVTVQPAPSPLANSTASQNISFSATDANGVASYRCRLGAAAYAACTSPSATGTLAIGANTFTVEATDNAGNVATGTTSITVDTAAPNLTVNAAPSPLTGSTSAQIITFSATSAAGGITYRCKLNAAAYAACTSPWSTGTLAAGLNTITVEARDANNKIATEAATINVDQTNPVVTVNAAPSPSTAATTSQNISFSATDANGVASYRCRLGAAAFVACTSPFATGTLAVGANSITVEATDNAGNVATSTTSITVDQTVPVVTVGAAAYPLGKATTSQDITFSAADASGISGYRCRLNSAAYAACTSPSASGTLSVGSNTFSVEATDNAGNVAVGSTTIIVDQTDPVITIAPAPSPITNSTATQNISFSATDASGVGILRCKLNAAAFANCTTPFATGTLAVGVNTITVNAIDNAGNPATITTTITVDQTSPVVTVNAAPSPLTNVTTSQNISFSAADANGVAAYRCRLGAAAYAACSSPWASGTLAAGANTITVEATDNGGNIATSTTSITVDQTVPVITVNAAPSPLTNVTTSQNISFSATDANGISGYRCKLGAAAYAACTSPRATGTLAAGSNTFSVEATDNAGNVATGTTTIIVDQTNPVVTVSAPPSPLTNVTTSQNISFSASDANGVASYRCKLGAAAYAACTSPRATGTLAAGSNTFSVEATDNAGNVATGTTTIIVDQTNPAVTVTAAPSPLTKVTTSQNISFSASDANGVASYRCKLNAAAYTACTSPRATGTLAAGSNTFSVEVTDNAGNVATGTTTIIVDQTNPVVTVNAAPAPVTNVTTSQNISFSATDANGVASYRCKLGAAAFAACTSPFASGTFAVGANTITVEATDNAGNVATGTTTITVDQTPPVVTVTAPAPLTNSTASQNVTFTATDNLAVASRQCKLDGGSYAACTSPYATGALAAGSHTVSVLVTDTAGNAVTQTAVIVVDTTAPVSSIDSGPPSPISSAAANFTFSSNEPGGTFQCKLDAAAWATCSSPLALSGLADGSHTLLVRAIDAAGNTDATPAGATWTVDTTAPSAPAITSPANGSSTNDNTPTISGTAEAGSTVRVFNGAAQIGTATANGGGNWSFTPSSALPDGTSSITARAVDAAGNVSNQSSAVSITLDATAPATTIGAKPPAQSNSAAAHFTFSADDIAATFECKLDGGSYAACTSPRDFSALGEGNHSFSVRGSDSAGNTESPAETYTWNVDLTAPAAPVISAPSAGQPIGDTTPTVSGTGEPGATITIYVNGSPSGSVTVDGSGNWTYTVAPALPAGPHKVKAAATDAAGNVSSDSPDRSFTVHPSAPADPLTPPTPTTPTTPTPIPVGTDPQCDTPPESDGVAAKMQVLGVSVSRKTLVKFKVSTDQFILGRITVKNGAKKLGTSIRAVNKGSRQIVVTIKKLPKKNAKLTVRLSSVSLSGGHGVATAALNVDAKGKLLLGSLAGGPAGSSASANCGPEKGGLKAKVKVLAAIAVGGKNKLTVSAKSTQFAVSTFMLEQGGKTYARTVYVLQPGKKLTKPLKLLGGNKLVAKGKYAMTITSFSADGVKTIAKKNITVK